MKGTYYNATGRRKNAIARVWLAPGTGAIEVNEKNLLDYFKRDTLKMIIEQPLEVTGSQGKWDIKAHVEGGGLTGQAGALLLGIARALVKANEELRPTLR
ncbi:MAG TPA: 30S ribosomal protein S9, partial [bacterium]|nr:30S ribosomal protein S9 [bacterium]